MSYPSVSLWFDQAATAGDQLAPRPGLDGDLTVDVGIVGGGLTGLWTAYYLLRADPTLRVAVLEAEIAGFGASGRNGGWCSALFPVGVQAMARHHGLGPALDMRRAMNETVDEVGRVAAAEGIDCHFVKGGTIELARSAVQLERVRTSVAADEARGGIDQYEIWDAAQTAARVRASGVVGAGFTASCARLQPALLVRGLADVVERLGGQVLERTPALEILPRTPDNGTGGAGPRVRTARGTVYAQHVIRATEAWTSQLPGTRRAIAPIYSLMVATEPLPASFWSSVGLSRGETFTDARHLVIYGQRTADDRIAFGGRGAPYHFGSRIDPSFDRHPRVFAALRRTLTELFPALRDFGFTHSWGGPLGIARDWNASVGLDASSGIGWAGGYVGDGLSTTNLAGRTLADLVLGHDTELVHLPWVGHRSPTWEPEPLRWLGTNAGLTAMTAADTEERLTKRESVAARLMSPLLGH
ncbi:FAD-binding oxidoreductase [Kineosporia sp. NBRC 101731]|uniref:NAD(P)/FAD-dependent oxidoreductase n=1 Tax=Kineosporia sp. NBRC 101731 TaxID=3032199 RepID=UPI0024A295BB|nr:FAD-binding oxidoreductase [Kineosporia sp. NBRC 101731]GLY30206.1 FAD-dependent oxidoreductase [Kineosporia sp. NBRC 101731]